jgi:hypothetical protein
MYCLTYYGYGFAYYGYISHGYAYYGYTYYGFLAHRQYVAERPAGSVNDGDGGGGSGGGGGRWREAEADAEAEAGGGGGGGGGLRLWYDPRFLLFEFVHNLVLREAQVITLALAVALALSLTLALAPALTSCGARQVALIKEFVTAVRSRRPLVKQVPYLLWPYLLWLCPSRSLRLYSLWLYFLPLLRLYLLWQMLMGGGKTTVVGPMLALMLADGVTLVVQTMPQAGYLVITPRGAGWLPSYHPSWCRRCRRLRVRPPRANLEQSKSQTTCTTIHHTPTIPAYTIHTTY